MRPSVAALRLARESGAPHPRRLASELSGDLDNILLKALAKAPEDRYVSVEALAQDLRRHLGGEPVLARPQSLGYRTQKFLRRNSVAMIVVMSVLGLMVTALGFMYWQSSKAIIEAQRAQAMQDFVVALFENTDQAGNGDGLDVRTLLDAGVRRADTELLGATAGARRTAGPGSAPAPGPGRRPQGAGAAGPAVAGAGHPGGRRAGAHRH